MVVKREKVVKIVGVELYVIADIQTKYKYLGIPQSWKP